MFLLEYEGKNLFKEYNIPIPRGFVLDADGEPYIPGDLDFPLVLKGQYLAGGRGKAGAIRIVRDRREFDEAFKAIRGIVLGGRRPKYILVEEYTPHERELYLSILVSKGDKGYLILASREGGVEVEELAKKPGALLKIFVNPLTGLMDFHKRIVSKFLLGHINRDFVELVGNLYRLVYERDLHLAEINPLGLRSDGKVIALDSKVIVDDNSSLRHNLSVFYEYQSILTEGEKKSREYGFAYVPLNGDIGVMGNGAGLTMATLDLIEYYGGKPACFVDIGGGASEERIGAALDVMLEEIKPKIVFVNIFAGITRCDDVARAIISVVKYRGINPDNFVIRLTGTNEDIGIKILKDAGFQVFKDMDEAARVAVSRYG